MSNTFKDKPIRVRFAQYQTEDGLFCFPADAKFSNRERMVGIGQGATKKIKRATSKKNRKRTDARTSMTGYGWGDDNYRYHWSD